jgi:hypothetical protein
MPVREEGPAPMREVPQHAASRQRPDYPTFTSAGGFHCPFNASSFG